MSRSARILSAALLAIAVTPATASAVRLWSAAGQSAPLSGTLSSLIATGTPVRLQLKRTVLWRYQPVAGSAAELAAATALSNGNVLVTDRGNAAVTELNRSRATVWSYSRADNPLMGDPQSVQRLANGNTLICDRQADFVIEVTPDKRIVWQYGSTPNSLAPGSLVDPRSAVRLSNGNTLICDGESGTRVIEVHSGDYDPGAPGLGYSADSIVWRFGGDNVPGSGPGQLLSPKKATRLPNGNTLIVDSPDLQAAGHRVLEVRPDGQVPWQYVMGSDTGLNGQPGRPTDAMRLANGHTLITQESGRSGLVEVDSAGQLVSPASLSDALGATAGIRTLQRTSSGGFVVVDTGANRVLEIGYPRTGTLTSGSLDLSLPGVKKVLSRIRAYGTTPSGTSVSVKYSLDGGAWRGGGASVSLPASSTAKLVRYRVTLTTNNAAVTPTLKDVRMTYDVAPSTTSTGTSATSGTGTTSGSGSGGTIGTGTGSLVGSPLTFSATSTAAVPGIADGQQALEGAPITGPRYTAGTLLQPIGPQTEGGGGASASKTRAAAEFAIALLALTYAFSTVQAAAVRSLRFSLRFVSALFGGK